MRCARCTTSSSAGSTICGASARNRAPCSKRCRMASSPPTSAASSSRRTQPPAGCSATEKPSRCRRSASSSTTAPVRTSRINARCARSWKSSHRALMREVLTGAVVEGRELDLGDRTVVVSARPLADGGTLLVLSDVTDLRRLETIRRDFVANVSHELKTPLTAIAGYAETLAAESSDSQTTGFAQTIVENAGRMQRLVDDLLDLSRIESGGWEPQPRTVGVEAAAREAWRRFTDRAADSRVQLETATNGATISGDP